MAMRSRRIIVGYDGSEAATRALDAAADLVGYGSTLAVITTHAGRVDGSTTSEAHRRLLRRHVEARYHETRGDPAAQLVEMAQELDADLLVIGRQSGSPDFPGSTSSRVVRNAHCDVLVVR